MTRRGPGPGMQQATQDRLLPNAGALLMAAGGLAALIGGVAGLARQDPTMVLLSVALLVGYGVVGYLLTSRGRAYFHFALPGAAVLVLLTLFLLRIVPLDEGGSYFLNPALMLLLSFAGGALLTYAIEEGTDRVQWPSKVGALNPLLHLAAYAPVWNAFVLLEISPGAGPWLRVVVLAVSSAAAIGCVVAGYAASRRNHPVITLVGAGAGFVVNAWYLIEFMTTRVSGDSAFGQMNALVGLVLTALPIAIATVAWLQLRAETPEDAAAVEPRPETP